MADNQEMEQTQKQKVEPPRNENDEIHTLTDEDIEDGVSINSGSNRQLDDFIAYLNPRNLVYDHGMVILKWIFCLFVILLLIYLMPRTFQNHDEGDQINGPTVLLWNEDWEQHQCSCMLNRDQYYSSLPIDAVIVNADQAFSLSGLEKIKHTPNFLLVFAAKNPLPLVQNPLTEYSPYYFNFTMSYRSDSDLRLTEYYFSTLYSSPQPVEKFEQPDRNFMMNMEDNLKSTLLYHLKRKRLLTAYIALNESNYTPTRSVYIEELRTQLEPKVIQKCDEHNECSTYKFMLVFQTTSCPDFMHSHIYMAMMNFVVPVVIGTGNISQFVPPGSYINGAEFTSPRKLAQFLINVGQEPHLYEQYFWWHSKYNIYQIRDTQSSTSYCAICAELRKPRRHRQPEEFFKWWTQHKCSDERTLWIDQMFQKIIKGP
ncbi:hypothetical protein KR093_005282 [Drosophila rubida]|uniref:Fucosyltransferase n=1 Tax=Drosophila rubida TaxID=30044 RepID=A0AAD4K0W8_9MUSC|nr:hypothetical protein KR093_005282 [Drosophila rubida]